MKSRIIYLYIPACVLLIAACALSLAWVSNGFQSLQGWDSFLAFLVLGGLVLAFGWWLIQGESPPRWLLSLLIGAAFLRLLLGAVWFVTLPTGGYNSPAEREGYVMADAFNRDKAAWRLSQSVKPLWKAIVVARGYRKVDQYGGMLLLSAFLYRYQGGAVHQPLQIVVLTSTASALAVAFAWGFARRAWGETAARIAAWGVALYPEAVLLGSSQMREAFMVALVPLAFYGLLRYLTRWSWIDLLWILIPLILCLPFSPPVTAFLMLLLIIQGFLMGNRYIFRQRSLWLFLGGLALLAVFGIWLTWKRLAPPEISGPFALILWWLRESISLQARTTRLDSGWMQLIFNSTPEWIHQMLTLAYGIARPLLPAALLDTTSTPLWRGIGIWRAIGWTLLLPLLLYAPVVSLRTPKRGQEMGYAIGRGLTLVVCFGIVIASLRAGADLWDNPRYRAMFAALQVVLAAWVWVCHHQAEDPWLKRVIVSLGLIMLWLVPWYLGRYTHFSWPVSDFFKTMGLGVVSAILYVFWDWAGKSRKQGK